MASVYVLVTFAIDKDAKNHSTVDKVEENAVSSNIKKPDTSDSGIVIVSDEVDTTEKHVHEKSDDNVAELEVPVADQTETESLSVNSSTTPKSINASSDVEEESSECDITSSESAKTVRQNDSSLQEDDGKVHEVTESESTCKHTGDDNEDNQTLTEGNSNGLKAVKFMLGSSVEDEGQTEGQTVDSHMLDLVGEEQADGEKKDFRPDYSRITSVEDYGGALKLTKEKISECLASHKVGDIFWRTCDNGSLVQVNFMIEYGKACENILQDMLKLGIGVVSKSSISMFPATYYCTESEECEKAESEGSLEEFKKSVKSRLLVAEVVESIKGNSKLTFDFIALIVLASSIAMLGLVENSSVILVASMLISPLMGPIMAGTFGIVIKNRELQQTGIKTELIGLGLCVLCGLIFGVVFGLVAISGAEWGREWPTTEMKSRGVARSLVIGIFIAIPSGAGVAFSILGGNAGSLVGVAISASLLPPAVNAGMLWAYSIISAFSPPEVIQNGTIAAGSSLSCFPFKNNEYVPVYSCKMAVESLLLGLISLLLTLLNIVFIFLMSVVVLKVKEVAPHTATSPAANQFWKKDIQVARKSYSTLKGSYSTSLRRQFLEEYSKVTGKLNSSSDDTYQVKAIMESLANSPEVKDVTNRLGTHKHLDFHWSSSDVRQPPGYPDMYQTVRHRFHPDSKVYKTIHSYSGHTKVTHKFLKRVTDAEVERETETQPKPKGLKVVIPELKMRKSSDANISGNRAFLITKVEDGTDSSQANKADCEPAESPTLDAVESFVSVATEADKLIEQV